MNLRVDLILEPEQRSASILNVKSLARIVTIVLPLLFVAFLAMQVMGLISSKNELKAVEAQWQATEPLEKKAQLLTQECRANSDLLDQLKGWGQSHLDWHRQVLNLMEKVPGNVQLQNLQVSQSLQVLDNKTPARMFALQLKGKAYGPKAEGSVKELERILSEDASFSNFVQKVEVPLFGADSSAGAAKDDRIFEIRCTYREQKFE